MSNIGLAEIHQGMAKYECLLTQLATQDALHSHAISQALPKLREARAWVEGALDDDPGTAWAGGKVSLKLFPRNQDEVGLL
jgi:hypothetical protein